MRTWRGWGKRLRAWIADGTRDHQLGDELESIVEMHIDEYLRSGMTRDEARRRALIEVGGLEQVRQAVRDEEMRHRAVVPVSVVSFIPRGYIRGGDTTRFRVPADEGRCCTRNGAG